MEVLLSRDSWHYRLQRFVFDDVPFQANFCPYFWLTIFCLFSLPFVLIWTWIKGPVLKASTAFFEGFFSLADIVEEKVCIPYKVRTFDSVTPEQAFLMYEAWEDRNMYGERRRNESLATKFLRWKNHFTSKFDSDEKWREFVEQGRENVLKLREKNQEIIREREQAERKRKERIKKAHLLIIKVTKAIFFTILSALALALTYIIFLMFYMLWERRSIIGSFFVNYGSTILLAIGVIIGFAALIALGVYAIKCLVSIVPPKAEEITKTENKVTSAIKGFFSFFWIFIVNFKKNHCPHIEWVDREGT